MSGKIIYPINVINSLNDEDETSTTINNNLIEEFVRLNQKCDDVIIKIRKRKSKKHVA